MEPRIRPYPGQFSIRRGRLDQLFVRPAHLLAAPRRASEVFLEAAQRALERLEREDAVGAVIEAIWLGHEVTVCVCLTSANLRTARRRQPTGGGRTAGPVSGAAVDLEQPQP